MTAPLSVGRAPAARLSHRTRLGRRFRHPRGHDVAGSVRYRPGHIGTSRPRAGGRARKGQAMRDLPGKVAVVTGVASGIGLALCRRFGADGMRVMMADVEEAALAAAARGLA